MRSKLGVFIVGLMFTANSVQADVVVDENVTYGKVGKRELKLDLARPDSKSKASPVIVFIHGGGWREGDRDRYRGEIEEAANRGYVGVTVSYRLVTVDEDTQKVTNPFPAAVEDVKCAVRWLRANAKKYRIDPERIGATGESAGGHLALMLGVTDGSEGLEGKGGNADESSRVQAVVNVFGPTDLKHLAETSPQTVDLLKDFLKGDPEKAAKAYKLASPITHVSEDDPPTLTIHGTVDDIVLPDQATRLDKAMKKAGVQHKVLMLKGQGHGFEGDAYEQHREATYDFFDKQLKNAK